MDDVELVITEAFANAVRHADNAGNTVTVAVEVRANMLRLEVRDHDSRPPCAPARTSALDDGGRGLLIVEALASRWGVLPRPDGKVVFAEFAPDATADEPPG